MNNNSQLIKKSLWTIAIIITIFIVAFIEVPGVNRDGPFYYFLVLLSIITVAIFFADKIIQPNYKNIGQKIAYHSIPILTLVIIILLQIIFKLFNFSFAYFVLSSLFTMALLFSSMVSLNKSFVGIHEMEVADHRVKLSDGIKAIRINEVVAQVKLCEILNGDEDFKREFGLLVNEVVYSNPTEIQETREIANKINLNIENLSRSIAGLKDEEEIPNLTNLCISTRLLIEEKNKIAQLYYKKI